MNPLLGFTPDADPMTPGVLTDCTNIIPGENGLQGAPVGIAPVSVPALADPCQGAAVVTKLDGSRRIIAGTADALYELLSGAWDDQSDTGGYTGSADSRWSICQFGDATLASNGAEGIQRSNGSGAFAEISGAPTAKIIFSVGAFVMALNVNDGASKVDGWHNCASFDDTDWVNDVATLSNSGRLVSTAGAITAGGRLGEFAIAYKENAIFIGQFVGAPIVWDFVEAPGEAGCVGQNAWCDVRGAHFVVGPDNFWMFDGSRPTAIGGGQVRQWYFDNSAPLYRYTTQCIFDKQNNRVWVFFAGRGSTTPNLALVYHVLTKQWGKVVLDMQAPINYISATMTIDDLDDLAATIDGLPDVPFDSQYWLAGGKSLSVFDDTNQLLSLTGESATSSFVTGDFGDDEQVTHLSEVRLRFQSNPTTATLTTVGRMNEGDTLSTGRTSTLTNGKFDTRQSARFHRGIFSFTGDFKTNAIRPKVVKEGER